LIGLAARRPAAGFAAHFARRVAKCGAKRAAEMCTAGKAVLISNLRNGAMFAWIGQDRVDAIESALLNEGGNAAVRFTDRISCRA
jgi:hypothetical protein